jgi:alkyl sulfatase BDS1-like metallo-beta-lactamase superfamily hydrolase
MRAVLTLSLLATYNHRFRGEKAAPDAVSPILWRQAQLNQQHGLFKVVEGVIKFGASTFPTSPFWKAIPD